MVFIVWKSSACGSIRIRVVLRLLYLGEFASVR